MINQTARRIPYPAVVGAAEGLLRESQQPYLDLSMNATVSIIIPTYNRCNDLRTTLISLEEQSAAELSLKIVVVDNASTDETASMVQAYQRSSSLRVQYLREGHRGLHYCRHAGALNSDSEILVYVDDDVRAAKGWLSALCSPFDDPQVSVVGGKIVPEWTSPPPAWIHAMPAGYLSLLDFGNSAFDLAWPYQVYGCNMAIRRSVFLNVRGFNPDGFSDPALRWLRGDGETGLLMKVYAKGLRVRYEPAALLWHRVPASRLSMDYFKVRAFNQGISDGYTSFRCRRFPLLSRLPQSSTRQGLWSRLDRIWRVFQSSLHKENMPLRRLSILMSYLAARIEYAIRFYMSARLRAHVYRDHYLDA